MNPSPNTLRGPVLGVFQSKDRTKVFYDKISRVYDLPSDRSEAPMRKAELALLGACNQESVLEIGFGAFEWTHRRFPNFLDCRPVYVREAIEQAGFNVDKALKKHVWIPVEIILGAKPMP